MYNQDKLNYSPFRSDMATMPQSPRKLEYKFSTEPLEHFLSILQSIYVDKQVHPSCLERTHTSKGNPSPCLEYDYQILSMPD